MKVFIGGLLPTQQRLVEAACPDGIELRFATSDKDPRSWVHTGSNCDYCIVVTDFVKHKHDEGLRAAGYRVIRHTGGISRLKKLLRELAERAQ